jgi:hypothetical protein
MRGQSALLDWEEDEVAGPDVTRRETLLLLAKMTSNTYFTPGARGWYNLTDEWNVVRRLFPSVRVPLPVNFCGLTFFLFALGYAGWVGARRRRLPRIRFCDGRQQHRGSHDQGHVHPDHWRRSYDREGQVERQPPVQLLLCACQSDMEDRMRLLPWRLEMQRGVRRESFDRRESILSHWHRTLSASLPHSL